MKRTEKVEATLTLAEKKIFRALCKEAGCTEAELIRSVLIHREISLERSLFLFHFRNLAIRDGAAGKLEMNVIVASFPAGSGKGSRLAL